MHDPANSREGANKICARADSKLVFPFSALHRRDVEKNGVPRSSNITYFFQIATTYCCVVDICAYVCVNANMKIA